MASALAYDKSSINSSFLVIVTMMIIEWKTAYLCSCSDPALTISMKTICVVTIPKNKQAPFLWNRNPPQCPAFSGYSAYNLLN